MPAAAPARRPAGVAFDPPAPSPRRALPRMDVAAFVGFAASGPVDVPVAVMDATRLADVFGTDLPLALDPDRGVVVTAQLVPAVRAFLRGGGRRAWVVRVAGRTARSSRFILPGVLVAAPGAARVAPAVLDARAPGAWADGITVATALTAVTALVTATGPGTLVLRHGPEPVVAGDVLRLRAGGHVRLLVVAAATTAHGTTTVALDPGAGLWLPDADTGTGPSTTAPPGAPTPAVGDLVERLRLELHVRTGPGAVRVLRDLGLAPGHARWIGDLPDDLLLFGPRARPGPDPLLWAEVDTPRFPLADRSGERAVFYPVGVATTPGPAAGPEPEADPPLRRDGLAAFSATPFLDDDLRGTGVAALPAAADAVRWLGPAPRPLTGIHAVWGLEEVTLLAVPDVGHRPWEPAPPPDTPPAPPSPAPEPPPPGGDFADCDAPAPPGTPLLEVGVEAGGAVVLRWTAVGDAVTYRLQEGGDPRGWDGARTVHLGPATTVTRRPHPDRLWFYRVRAEHGGQVGAWSGGVVADLRRRPGAVLAPLPAYRPDVLLEVQRAALRLCAARRDVLAVLGPPRHHRDADAAAHADALRAGEPEACAFGTLHHPWLMLAPRPGDTVDRPGEVVEIGPDGPVAAVLARRALARGAWVAPANEDLTDAVALVGPAADPARLLAAQVGLVRREGGGFRQLSQDTLATDPQLRPVNVRRLVALLRRLLLREGTDHAFEPNDAVLRRGVERGLGELLAQMYRLGAFAGDTAGEAFRVDALDTAADRDAGRLVVEVRFAPSRPLEFLLVRFVRADDGGTILETP